MVDALILQATGITLNVLFGIITLVTYYFCLWESIGEYNRHMAENKQDPINRKVLNARKWMWAAYYGNTPFRIWAISSFLAALSFIYLFASVACTEKITLEYLISNACFLFFSIMYAPLVERAHNFSKDGVDNMFWPEVAVVVDLFLVSASAWCMVGFLVPSNDVLKILASVMLTTHTL